MKGIDNNELCLSILEKTKQELEKRIREIYNQAYAQGYKDGAEDEYRAYKQSRKKFEIEVW